MSIYFFKKITPPDDEVKHTISYAIMFIIHKIKAITTSPHFETQSILTSDNKDKALELINEVIAEAKSKETTANN